MLQHTCDKCKKALGNSLYTMQVGPRYVYGFELCDDCFSPYLSLLKFDGIDTSRIESLIEEGKEKHSNSDLNNF